MKMRSADSERRERRSEMYSHSSSREERVRQERPESAMNKLRREQREEELKIGERHRREGQEHNDRARNTNNRRYPNGPVPDREVTAQKEARSRMEADHARERADVAAKHRRQRDDLRSRL